MFFDVYMIILTAFAVFGVYCFMEMIYTAITGRNAPVSVTVMALDSGEATREKAKNIRNTLSNNYVVYISDDTGEAETEDGIRVCRFCEISSYITDVLFTKKTY